MSGTGSVAFRELVADTSALFASDSSGEPVVYEIQEELALGGICEPQVFVDGEELDSLNRDIEGRKDTGVEDGLPVCIVGGNLLVRGAEGVDVGHLFDSGELTNWNFSLIRYCSTRLQHRAVRIRYEVDEYEGE